jgi:thiol-disulfide isomerase/thioredoxin
MKPKTILIIALLIVLGACKRKEVETIISGRLPNITNEKITLIPVDDYSPGLESNGNYITTETDSLGVFRFRINQIKSTYYQIIHYNYSQLNYDIFLELGDSIYIEQSSWNEKPHMIISGKGAEKLNYLIKDYEIFPKDKSFYDKIRSDSFLTEMDFKRYIDSIHFMRMDNINSNTSIPTDFKLHLIYIINAERAIFLLEHLERRNYYMNGEFNYFFPNRAYLAFLDSINFDNLFCKTTAAKKLANSYLMNKAQNAFKDEDEEKWWNENLLWKWNYISNQTKSEWTDLLALSTISEYSFGLMLDDFFDNLLRFEEKMDSLFYSEVNSQLFESNISPYSNLAPGREAPNFELPDSSGVLHQLSDYKGKIVYLDFWGTWCYPCIQEIPDALLLQEKYKEKPVVFIYIALEYDSTDIANWKKFIAGQDERFGKLLNNKPFPGVHLVAEKQFRNESIGDYKINFAPTQVLIDHQGNIVNARAKRSKEISEDIDKLLKEIYEE